MLMRRFWIAVNLAVIGSAFYGGFEEAGPDHHLNTNADWIFITLSFILTALFPFGAMYYSRSIGVAEWKRPSFDRNPLRWWTDPLQPLRISILAMCTYTLGATAALPHTDKQGVMLFWWNVAILAGLTLGERFVYWWFKAQIR
jgi:hypothetical protein